MQQITTGYIKGNIPVYPGNQTWQAGKSSKTNTLFFWGFLYIEVHEDVPANKI
jgi:hypothetical protein